MKRLLSLLLVLCLLPVFALAAPEYKKEEVIYAVLSGTGTVDAVYAVNIFNLTQPAAVVDYGAYSAVQNLTDLAPIQYENDEIRIETSSRRLFYQGDMGKVALPWDIRLSYTLDGAAIAPEALAGKTGRIEISLDISKNEAVSAEYFDSLMCQATITLNGDNCLNITAPDVTIANAGSKKSLTIAALPGQGAHAKISFDAEQFAMDGVSIAAVPYSMSLSAPDTSAFTAQLTSLSTAISTFSASVTALNNSAASLSTNALTLSSGASLAAGGLTEAVSGAKDLAAAAQGLSAAISSVSTQLQNSQDEELLKLSAQVTALEENANTLAASLTAYSEGLDTAQAGVQGAADGVSALSTALTEYAKGFSSLKVGVSALETMTSDLPAQVEQTVTSLLSSYDHSGYQPTSFTSPKNGVIESIQFVFVTAPIEAPVEATPAPAQQPQDFLSRLKRLFE